MINLLPPAVKENILYGRRNRLLFRWIVAMLVVLIGVSAMIVLGQIYINKNIKSLQSVEKITKERMARQNVEVTQKELQTLSNNFTVVTRLLSRQILISKILTKIGNIMPNDAYLNDINLSADSTFLDLNVLAKSREAATQAFINISDPKNGLFDKSDLVSVNHNAVSATGGNISSSTSTGYPYSATIRVTFKTDSSFYFLSSITQNGRTKP